jgi:hypothetical protein
MTFPWLTWQGGESKTVQKVRRVSSGHSRLRLFGWGPSLKRLKLAPVPIRENSSTFEDFFKYFERERLAIQNTPNDVWIDASTGGTRLSNLHPGFDALLFHKIFKVCPKPNPAQQWASSLEFTVELATPFITHMFFSHIKCKTFVEMLIYASRFNISSSVRAHLFEIASIRFLSWSLEQTSVKLAQNNASVSIPAMLPTFQVALKLKRRFSPPPPGVLHVARIGTATFDAVYTEDSGRTILFHTITAKSHDIAPKGIR